MVLLLLVVVVLVRHPVVPLKLVVTLVVFDLQVLQLGQEASSQEP